jgi:hypothetical protein
MWPYTFCAMMVVIISRMIDDDCCERKDRS